LFHCISAESENLIQDYKIIREELQNYDADLGKKEEYIILTKTDLVDAKEVKKKIKDLKKINPKVHAISIYDEKSVEKIKNLLSKIKIKK
jgi:GTP-binding protein